MVEFDGQPGPEYAHLTFPRFGARLSKPGEDTIALGLRVAEGPVGLALLWCPRDSGDPARVLSVMIAGHHRRRGFARMLLKRMELVARERGWSALTAWYSSRLPSLEGVERLLAASGWETPQVCEYRTAGFAAAGAVELDRIEPERRPYLPVDAEIAPWSSVTDEERAQVDALVGEIEFSPRMAPAMHEKIAHPELSCVLRHRGRIAGWVFGEMATPLFCHYNCGYVTPELRRRGALVALIRAVCRRQAALFGPESVAQLSTTPATPGMLRFMRERLKACALWFDEMRQSSKTLVRPSSA